METMTLPVDYSQAYDLAAVGGVGAAVSTGSDGVMPRDYHSLTSNRVGTLSRGFHGSPRSIDDVMSRDYHGTAAVLSCTPISSYGAYDGPSYRSLLAWPQQYNSNGPAPTRPPPPLVSYSK